MGRGPVSPGPVVWAEGDGSRVDGAPQLGRRRNCHLSPSMQQNSLHKDSDTRHSQVLGAGGVLLRPCTRTPEEALGWAQVAPEEGGPGGRKERRGRQGRGRQREAFRALFSRLLETRVGRRQVAHCGALGWEQRHPRAQGHAGTGLCWPEAAWLGAAPEPGGAR